MTALWAIEHAPDNVFNGGGGSTGFGVCGGAGATAYLPVLLAKEIGGIDPEFQERVRKATKKAAMLLIQSGTHVGETLVWPLKPWERKHHQIKSDFITVNMALDYGQTGVVLSLAEMGKYLEDEQVLKAARKAADFIINNAVKTEHGWKFARFVHLKSNGI